MNAPARRFVDTSTGRIAYCTADGDGETLVLIHGALVTADDMMFALGAHLAPRYRVVAMDRPGHGGSDPHLSDPGSLWAQATMLMEACRALNLGPARLIGHSLGGAVALAAAMAEPDAVADTMALAPICYPEPRLEQALFGPRAAPLGGGMLARTLGPAMDEGTLPLLRNAMFLPQAMPSAYAETFPFAWASRPGPMVSGAKDSMAMWGSLTRSAWSYAGCRVPVTIMGGTHDLVVNNAAHGLVAASAIPGATFRWVPGSGHMIHHFHQDLVGEALRAVSHGVEAMV